MTQELKTAFRETYDAGDPWGSCMAWRFAIADYLEFETDAGTPTEWHFKPAPFGPAEESYEFQELQRIKPDASDLEEFGEILLRFDNMCRRQGLNY